MQKLEKKIRENLFFIIASGAVFIFYYLIFGAYFPNASGGLGYDFSLQLPHLLAGYYWFQNNGLFSIPWFNPAECGGVPFYADPGFGLYSLPQFLTLFFNPLMAIKITFFIFAAVGYFGFYLLLRRKFKIDKRFAVVGGALFLFNGFYAYRMIIGHPFHAFMLLPYLAILFLPDIPQPKSFFNKKNIFYITLAGIILAYMFHSAMMHIIPPAVLSVAVILLIHAYLYGGDKIVWLRAVSASFLAIGLSISKLVAALSFLKYAPRDLYPIPGFPKLFDAINVIIQSLFFRPPADLVMQRIINSQWAIRQHELEFGVTWVPLIIILIAIVWYIFLLLKKQAKFIPSKRTIVYFGVIILLLFLPVAVNLYTPSWSKILKSIPVIKNSFLMLRWFAAYMPVSILVAILALNSKAKRYAMWVTVVLLFVIINYQNSENRSHYNEQTYNGELINQAYTRAKLSGTIEPIKGIGIAEANPALGKNDIMTAGLSSLACYHPMFGYRLEQFTKGDLHPGSVFDITDNHFNIKNPSCYVFPKENNCRPGDHFKIEERGEVEKFLQYKPFSFKKSFLQKIADKINLAFLIAVFLILIYPLVRRLFKHKNF